MDNTNWETIYIHKPTNRLVYPTGYGIYFGKEYVKLQNGRIEKVNSSDLKKEKVTVQNPPK